MKTGAFFWLVLIALMVSGCATRYREPNLGALYTHTVQASEFDRNPVIVIPGILGSRLIDRRSNRIVWGAFGSGAANPENPQDLRLIAHPIGFGKQLSELHDSVESEGALDTLRVKLLGLPFELGAYVNILAALGAGGYRDESLGRSREIDYGNDHFTCFQFAYDWRRDIVESAKQLDAFIREKQRQVREQYQKRGAPDRKVKFDLVAHSMGGLVARYYLMYGAADLPVDGSLPEVTWAGAPFVETIVMVGTPNAGSADALFDLVDGVNFSPFFPRYPAGLLATMPSIYELLPRGRHGSVVQLNRDKKPIENLYDPKLWEELGWGLAAQEHDDVLRALLPDEADPDRRREIALEHQGKSLLRAQQFAAAMDRPTTLPPGVTLHLIAGDATPTPSRIGVDTANGKVRTLEEAPGDGTVLRSSALLDERIGGRWSPRLITPIPWTQVTFLFDDHLGLTKAPTFTDNLLFLLLEKPVFAQERETPPLIPAGTGTRTSGS